MRTFRLIGQFMRASFQEEAASRTNFFVNLLHSILNLGTGVLGVVVLFGQIDEVQGWNLASTLALLGVYLIVSALRGLFIGPGLDALAGMDGKIWSGTFDFTILRPLNTQFLVSVHKWRLFAILDLGLGLGVLGAAVARLGVSLSAGQVVAFLLALFAGVLTLYAILLAFAALVFWSPGVLFTWVFDAFFQMARYPVGMYPGWLRLVLTWVIPVGIITTVPAQALSGSLTPGMLFGGLGLAALLVVGASLLFRRGLRRYASASS
ncbi:MAG: ABC-2 family transporter protein [Anaerolineales bacterium]|nr:ABC-2 family transporter protein [Anaerolineales bacterium]